VRHGWTSASRIIYLQGMALVLASASPRRQELLRAAGIAFRVSPANVAEVVEPGEAPVTYAQRLAREKARAVAERLGKSGECVLGADTVVVVDGQILEKPANAEDAKRMLGLLSGRMHEVTTGVCLISPELTCEDVRAETTRVWMAEVPEEEITAYVASGDPMDKAGGYGIQGIASRWIPRIEGCYFNVVGLPVPLVYRMLRALGCGELGIARKS
jgi:septum formation protein